MARMKTARACLKSMSMSVPSILALTLALAGSACTHRLQAQESQRPVVGVNVNSFQNFDAAAQETIVQQLVMAGVRCVRTSLRLDDKNLRLAKELQSKGIGLVLVPSPEYPSDARMRPANAQYHMRSAYPLSQADPAKSRVAFKAIFDKLDANGIVLTGIELGNELNWTDFNGDFPIPGQGRSFNLQDLSSDPEAQKVATGLLQYLKILAVLKEVRGQSKWNAHTPIIAAGMAALPDQAWLQHVHLDAVAVPATYRFLRAHGLDDLVDGYGVHYYPAEVAPGDPAGMAKRLSVMQNLVFPPLGNKPYWLTEWGFKSTAPAGSHDPARERSVAELRTAFQPLIRQGRLDGMFWYVWNEPDPYSIFRDGVLVDGAKAAIAPAR